MVTITVRGPKATVHGDLPDALKEQLYLQCSFPHARAIWHPDTLQPWDDGRITVYYPKSGRLPTGCVPRLEHLLSSLDLPYEVDRPLPSPNHPFPHFPARTYDSRSYQAAMLAAALDHPYATIQAPARSGKTFVAACYLACRQLTPALFLVNTIDLCHQAREELSTWLGEPVGLIGDGHYEPEPVTVASIQSLHPALVRCGLAKRVNPKYDPTYAEELPLPRHHEVVELLQATQVRVADENHFCTAPTHQAVHRAMTNCSYSIGLSATPWSEDGDGILIEASCGPVVIHIHYSDLIDEGKLVEPYIEVKELPLRRFPKGTSYQTVYKEDVTENEHMTREIVRFVERMLADNHSVIVFVDQIKHGKMLAKLCNATFVHGGITGDDRKDLWDAMRNRSLRAVVSTVGKYGLDIPPLDACVWAGGGAALAPVLQGISRVLTACEGKDHAHVLDFMHHARYLTEHSTRRVNLYQTERRFNVSIERVDN